MPNPPSTQNDFDTAISIAVEEFSSVKIDEAISKYSDFSQNAPNSEYFTTRFSSLIAPKDNYDYFEKVRIIKEFITIVSILDKYHPEQAKTFIEENYNCFIPLWASLIDDFKNQESSQNYLEYFLALHSLSTQKMLETFKRVAQIQQKDNKFDDFEQKSHIIANFYLNYNNLVHYNLLISYSDPTLANKDNAFPLGQLFLQLLIIYELSIKSKKSPILIMVPLKLDELDDYVPDDNHSLKADLNLLLKNISQNKDIANLCTKWFLHFHQLERKNDKITNPAFYTIAKLAKMIFSELKNHNKPVVSPMQLGGQPIEVKRLIHNLQIADKLATVGELFDKLVAMCTNPTNEQDLNFDDIKQKLYALDDKRCFQDFLKRYIDKYDYNNTLRFNNDNNLVASTVGATVFKISEDVASNPNNSSWIGKQYSKARAFFCDHNMLWITTTVSNITSNKANNNTYEQYLNLIKAYELISLDTIIENYKSISKKSKNKAFRIKNYFSYLVCAKFIEFLEDERRPNLNPEFLKLCDFENLLCREHNQKTQDLDFYTKDLLLKKDIFNKAQDIFNIISKSYDDKSKQKPKTKHKINNLQQKIQACKNNGTPQALLTVLSCLNDHIDQLKTHPEQYAELFSSILELLKKQSERFFNLRADNSYGLDGLIASILAKIHGQLRNLSGLNQVDKAFKSLSIAGASKNTKNAKKKKNKVEKQSTIEPQNSIKDDFVFARISDHAPNQEVSELQNIAEKLYAGESYISIVQSSQFDTNCEKIATSKGKDYLLNIPVEILTNLNSSKPEDILKLINIYINIFELIKASESRQAPESAKYFWNNPECSITIQQQFALNNFARLIYSLLDKLHVFTLPNLLLDPNNANEFTAYTKVFVEYNTLVASAITFNYDIITLFTEIKSRVNTSEKALKSARYFCDNFAKPTIDLLVILPILIKNLHLLHGQLSMELHQEFKQIIEFIYRNIQTIAEKNNISSLIGTLTKASFCSSNLEQQIIRFLQNTNQEDDGPTNQICNFALSYFETNNERLSRDNILTYQQAVESLRSLSKMRFDLEPTGPNLNDTSSIVAHMATLFGNMVRPSDNLDNSETLEYQYIEYQYIVEQELKKIIAYVNTWPNSILKNYLLFHIYEIIYTEIKLPVTFEHELTEAIDSFNDFLVNKTIERYNTFFTSETGQSYLTKRFKILPTPQNFELNIIIIKEFVIAAYILNKYHAKDFSKFINEYSELFITAWYNAIIQFNNAQQAEKSPYFAKLNNLIQEQLKEIIDLVANNLSLEFQQKLEFIAKFYLSYDNVNAYKILIKGTNPKQQAKSYDELSKLQNPALSQAFCDLLLAYDTFTKKPTSDATLKLIISDKHNQENRYKLEDGSTLSIDLLRIIQSTALADDVSKICKKWQQHFIKLGVHAHVCNNKVLENIAKLANMILNSLLNHYAQPCQARLGAMEFCHNGSLISMTKMSNAIDKIQKTGQLFTKLQQLASTVVKEKRMLEPKADTQVLSNEIEQLNEPACMLDLMSRFAKKYDYTGKINYDHNACMQAIMVGGAITYIIEQFKLKYQDQSWIKQKCAFVFYNLLQEYFFLAISNILDDIIQFNHNLEDTYNLYENLLNLYAIVPIEIVKKYHTESLIHDPCEAKVEFRQENLRRFLSAAKILEFMCCVQGLNYNSTYKAICAIETKLPNLTKEQNTSHDTDNFNAVVDKKNILLKLQALLLTSGCIKSIASKSIAKTKNTTFEHDKLDIQIKNLNSLIAKKEASDCKVLAFIKSLESQYSSLQKRIQQIKQPNQKEMITELLVSLKSTFSNLSEFYLEQARTTPSYGLNGLIAHLTKKAAEHFMGLIFSNQANCELKDSSIFETETESDSDTEIEDLEKLLKNASLEEEKNTKRQVKTKKTQRKPSPNEQSSKVKGKSKKKNHDTGSVDPQKAEKKRRLKEERKLRMEQELKKAKDKIESDKQRVQAEAIEAEKAVFLANHKLNVSTFDNVAIPDQLITFMEYLEDTGYLAVITGGYVRDHLHGVEDVNDYDILTSAPRDVINNYFKNYKNVSLQGIPNKPDILQIYGFTDKHIDLKIAKGIGYNDTIANTLKAYDISINTYCLTRNRILFSPFSEYRDDYKDQSLKIIGDPLQRFANSPVIILRLIRFANKLRKIIHKDVVEDIQNSAKLIKSIPFGAFLANLRKLFNSKYRINNLQTIFGLNIAKDIFDINPANLLDQNTFIELMSLWPLDTRHMEYKVIAIFLYGDYIKLSKESGSTNQALSQIYSKFIQSYTGPKEPDKIGYLFGHLATTFNEIDSHFASRSQVSQEYANYTPHYTNERHKVSYKAAAAGGGNKQSCLTSKPQ